jgi:hypothetical protein
MGTQPAECQKGPPTTVRLEGVDPPAEFAWTGSDMSVDLEVPGPSATPRELPGTGGPP